jgi:hypothetical protein
MTSNTDKTGCEKDKVLEALSNLPPQSSVLDALFKKGVASYGAVCIAVAFTALAGLVSYKKESSKSKLALLQRLQVVLKSLLPGFTFGSEIFLIIGVMQDCPGTGATMLLFRLLHAVAAVCIIIILFGPIGIATRFEAIINGSTSLREDIDEQFSRENIPFIGVLLVFCLFDVTMLQFMPWKESRFYTESKGFPRFSLLQVCLITKTVQSFASAVCQVVFLSANASLDDPTMSAQGKTLFALNIIFSILGVVLGLMMLCLKETFLRKVETGEVEATSRQADGFGMHDLYSGSGTWQDDIRVSTVNPIIMGGDNNDTLESQYANTHSRKRTFDDSDPTMMCNPLHEPRGEDREDPIVFMANAQPFLSDEQVMDALGCNAGDDTRDNSHPVVGIPMVMTSVSMRLTGEEIAALTALQSDAAPEMNTVEGEAQSDNGRDGSPTSPPQQQQGE